MPQHDQVVANDTGAAVRADINAALAAIFGLSSGATEPAVTVAFMLWADTTAGYLKQRNAANSAWIIKDTLANAEGMFPDGAVGAPGIGFASDTDNGWYRVDANSWAAAVAGAQALLFHAGGEIRMPLQPAFLAFLSSSAADSTGAGTEYNVLFDVEVYDQGADFTAGAAAPFTAPVTGRYLLSFGVLVQDLSTAATQLRLRINTSNRGYVLQTGLNPKAGALETGGVLTVIADMDAGDGMAAFVRVQGMAGDTADVYGDNSGILATFISGVLEA